MKLQGSLLFLLVRPISKHSRLVTTHLPFPVLKTSSVLCFNRVDFSLSFGLSSLLQSPWLKPPLPVELACNFCFDMISFAIFQVIGGTLRNVLRKNCLREKDRRIQLTYRRQWPTHISRVKKKTQNSQTHVFKDKSDRLYNIYIYISYICLAFSINSVFFAFSPNLCLTIQVASTF